MTTPFRLLAACVACLSFSAPSLAEEAPAPQAEQEIAHAAMHKAIWARDPEAVNALIKSGLDVNARNKDGQTVLMAAVQSNAINVVTYDTAPKECARSEASAVKIVQALIAAGADVNAQNPEGETALHMAASHADGAMVKLLLKAGADVNVRDKDGRTALFEALRYVVNTVQCEIPDPKEEARLNAIALNIVKALIAAGADVNVKNADGRTPFMECVYDIISFKVLLEVHADKNERVKKGCTPLLYAVNGKWSPWLKPLINAKPDVNARDLQGKTALFYAAASSEEEMVKALLKAGADPNVKDNLGKTALMLAAGRGRAENARLLLSARADVNAKDNKGETALMSAAWSLSPKWRGYVNLDVYKVLIQAGADVNAKDNEGKTALDWARRDEVKALLRKSGAK